MRTPPDIFTYRVIRPSELTAEQRDVLRRAGRERVHERLVHLLGEGKVSASVLAARYGTLMREAGDA